MDETRKLFPSIPMVVVFLFGERRAELICERYNYFHAENSAGGTGSRWKQKQITPANIAEDYTEAGFINYAIYLTKGEGEGGREGGFF